MRGMPDLAAGPAVRLGPDIKVRVGQQLRVIYGDAELLKRLDDLKDATTE